MKCQVHSGYRNISFIFQFTEQDAVMGQIMFFGPDQVDICAQAQALSPCYEGLLDE